MSCDRPLLLTESTTEINEMAKYQKRSNPPIAGTSTVKLDEINPGTVTDEGTKSEELFSLVANDLIDSAKQRQEVALLELQEEMNFLAADFAARAVSIVEEGFKNSFLQASQQIRQIQIGWTSDIGGLSDGNTLNTIALPGTITAGDTE